MKMSRIQTDAAPGDLVITANGYAGIVVGVYVRLNNNVEYQVETIVNPGQVNTITVREVFTMPYVYRDHVQAQARIAAEKVCERYAELRAKMEEERQKKREEERA